jgi:hypothetical protein
MIDDAITRYAKNIHDRVAYLNSVSRRAVLVDIRTQAEGLIRVLNFSLGREFKGELSINIDHIQPIEPIINGSVTALETTGNTEIATQSNIIRSCQYCGSEMRNRRLDAKFCSKNCNNKSRYKNGKYPSLDA